MPRSKNKRKQKSPTLERTESQTSVFFTESSCEGNLGISRAQSFPTIHIQNPSVPYGEIDALKAQLEEQSKLLNRVSQSVEYLIQKQNDDVFFKEDEILEVEDDDVDLITEYPHCQVLRSKFDDIVGNVDPNSLLASLVSRNVITPDDESSIYVQTTSRKKIRRLVTILGKKTPEKFDGFLKVIKEDRCYKKIHKTLQDALDSARKEKICRSCHIAQSVEICRIADSMYRTRSIKEHEYRDLVSDTIPVTTKWKCLRTLTQPNTEGRDGFISALEELYPRLQDKVKFSLEEWGLYCHCPNRHRQKSFNTDTPMKPKTLRRRHGFQVSQQIQDYIKSHPEIPDNQSSATIERFLRTEEVDEVEDVAKPVADVQVKDEALTKTVENKRKTTSFVCCVVLSGLLLTVFSIMAALYKITNDLSEMMAVFLNLFSRPLGLIGSLCVVWFLIFVAVYLLIK